MAVPYNTEGVYSHVPVKQEFGSDFFDEAEEGQTLRIPAGTIYDVIQATWGAGHSNVDITSHIRSQLRDGGLQVLATSENLQVLDPAQGQKKRLVVRYTETFYVEQDKRLEGVDLNTTEGKLQEAEVTIDRLVHENKRMKETLIKNERRDNHYREIEGKLREEILLRRKLEQSVYDNEGALVATRISELERDVNRLRLMLRNEQQAVINEQQQRKVLQDELNLLKDTKGGTNGVIQQQIADLRVENDRLMTQMQDVNRLNVQLQLSMKDQAEFDNLRADMFAKDNIDPVTGALPLSTSHVRVRKSVLCGKCKASVESWERQAISRNTARNLHREPSPPPLHPAHSTTYRAHDAGWRAFTTPNTPTPVYHNVLTARTQYSQPSQPSQPSSFTRI
eukprot:TRINITY_DN17202_c0_g2_i1.p1 TRINITY_DN17202_c0_g2~~TRINITY_DN17202_c0_g2_i1.p1  ORF type:complete len:393 (+),score=124.18 TRINITY_DN17202_c0_g2_i1:640-1818(+)